MPKTNDIASSLSFDSFKEQLLTTIIIVLSRECSLLGRKEALTGRQSLVFLEMEKNYHN